MIDPYSACRLCPHACGVDRNAGEIGVCEEGVQMRIASAGIHRGEEPIISVVDDTYTGSGTIFFSGCSLGCHDCQNIQISRKTRSLGRTVSSAEFAAVCIELQNRGAANINLVTGTHFIPSIIEGLVEAKASGLKIPIVWNTSSFESEEGMSLLFPHIDIFLADLKIIDEASYSLFCDCSEYIPSAPDAIRQMVEGRELSFDGDRLLTGVIFRHLFLPGQLKNTKEVLSWFKEHIIDTTILSLMVQYIPVRDDSVIGRTTSVDEYAELLEILEELGIEDGFLQELGEEDSWIPDFSKINPFPGDFYTPVWHYSDQASGPIEVPS